MAKGVSDTHGMMEKHINDISTNVNTQTKIIENHEKNINQFNKDVKELNTKHHELVNLIKTLEGQKEDLRLKLDIANSRIDLLQKKDIADLETKHSDLKHNLKDLKKDLEKISKENIDLRDDTKESFEALQRILGEKQLEPAIREKIAKGMIDGNDTEFQIMFYQMPIALQIESLREYALLQRKLLLVERNHVDDMQFQLGRLQAKVEDMADGTYPYNPNNYTPEVKVSNKNDDKVDGKGLLESGVSATAVGAGLAAAAFASSTGVKALDNSKL